MPKQLVHHPHKAKLVEIYRMEPRQLEVEYFAKREKKWDDSGGRDINNPKIPLNFVKPFETLAYVQD
jgi:hypothetical protein